MSNYRAQLLAVEAKLAKDPENEELLALKSDLTDYIELAGGLEEEEDEQPVKEEEIPSNPEEQRSKQGQPQVKSNSGPDETNKLPRKREKNKKKKAKLSEQLDIAESEKRSWQSFANQKGLKGLAKKSIFASPSSFSGKVGVGTNGIADVPSAAELRTRRKHK